MSKIDLQKLADEHFAANPNETHCHATSDGNVWMHKDKSWAEHHAKGLNESVQTFVKPESERPSDKFIREVKANISKKMADLKGKKADAEGTEKADAEGTEKAEAEGTEKTETEGTEKAEAEGTEKAKKEAATKTTAAKKDTKKTAKK
jgi:flagellar biosynthesis/type III secretory pathway protein FliH